MEMMLKASGQQTIKMSEIYPANILTAHYINHPLLSKGGNWRGDRMATVQQREFAHQGETS